MQEATQKDRDDLLAFLGSDLVNCLYLYLDIYHYGIGPKGVPVWYEFGENGYRLIVMKYGDSLQVYSPANDFDRQAFRSFAGRVNAVRIHARKDTVQLLEPLFTESTAS